MSSEFLHNTDRVFLKTVVKITFIEDVLGPTFLIEPLFPWEYSPMHHPGIDLTIISFCSIEEVGNSLPWSY